MATSNFRTIQTNFTEGVQFTKNYIPNSTFQNGSKNGWDLFTTTLTSGLPTGALTLGSAASITTFSVTTTTPISGSHSMQIGSSAAWSAGQGVITDTFTIEREDLGKPVAFSLSFEAIANATNANWSGILGSQTFAVYVYDVTNSTWLQPSGFLGMNQNSGVGQVMGSFQTSSTSGQQYRLAIIALQASSGAITINVDNVFLGKQISTVGTPVTDFVQFTPTINWTSGYTTSGYYRRVGDSIDVIVKIAFNLAPTPSGTDLLINLPAGLSIDTAKMLSPVAGGAPTCGDAVFYNEGTPSFHIFRCQYFSSTSVKVYFQSSVTNGLESPITTQTPILVAASDYLIARYTVPVVGFSSSVQMSNATDTRVISFSGSQTSQAVTANTTNISFTTIKDSNGAWSTNQYVVPVTGDYLVSASMITSGAGSLDVYKNGSRYGAYLGTSSSAGGFSVGGSALVTNLVAGDIISIRYTQSVTLTSGYLSIHRLSGPSVVAANETVSCRYTTAAGQSIPNNTYTTVVYGTKSYDTHNFMNSSTGVATIPVSGKYSISVLNVWASTTWATGQSSVLALYVNGVSYGNIYYLTPQANAAIAFNAILGGSIEANFNAGDTVAVRIQQNKGGSINLANDASLNYVHITRVGN